MKHSGIIIFLSLHFLIACESSKQKSYDTVFSKDTPAIDIPGQSEFDAMDKVSAFMINKVKLDSLMIEITRQQNVRVITSLKEGMKDTTNIRTYSGGGYYFELKIENQATTFIDGNTKIKFNDHTILCMPDSPFVCEDYGFKIDNSLSDPQIIEVAGRRFLYSPVSYWCNGIGCGFFITFIYDLEKKKATFLENYRIPFDGFFLSDFDNDKNPDLLVIGQTHEREMKGFGFYEFEIRLSWYSYENGSFKPKFDQQFRRPICNELYSFTPDYNHSNLIDQVCSITKDNWLRF